MCLFCVDRALCTCRCDAHVMIPNRFSTIKATQLSMCPLCGCVEEPDELKTPAELVRCK